ncbi:FAD binding domain-containing protein [Georgenia thermotolerans]|uniref:Xanthine dehydrogenase family protein subunit M n=1 Tax=Georgenia thermotolerans TaxID=527326 RepID=A0A7J5UUE4_9MICO|nr:xanthine dehydrogenase family protein subunit M [Georgenia thermotolerans]KAE8765911.1 xanthine dehydrogenase family protein subunit M [Georgenia thermotolerans]
MKPSAFAYYDPETLDEAAALKREHGSDALILAGGLSLMPLISMRITRPRVLIDINRIAELQRVGRNDGHMEIGAGVRQHAVEVDAEVREQLPLVAEMVTYIGHPEIRHRGTVGGSLSFADPATELPCASVTLDAEMVVAGPTGTRIVKASDFFVGAMANAIGPDELLVAVRIPAEPPGRHGFVEVSRRVGDRPLAAAAAQIALDDDGRVVSAAVGVANIADRPLRATAVEQALLGQVPTDELITEAAQTVAEQVSNGDDIHATRAYRKHVAAVITARSIRAAVTRGTRGDQS